MKSGRPKPRFKYPEIEEVREPFCGIRRRNMKVLADYEPEIAAEWCYGKNCGWGPEDFTRGSGVKAWWTCPKCNRDYKAKINSRTANRSGCSYCASKLVCDDNSLTVLFPEVAKEWHPKLNKDKPEGYTYGSNKMVWWRCSECRHEWQAHISDRTTLESGCPGCYEARMEHARKNPPPRKRGHVILNAENNPVSRAWYDNGKIEFTPLSESHPEVAKLWHPTLNGEWTPDDFAHGSEAIAWWKCPKGPDHVWQSPIYARTSPRASGCRFCTSRKVSITNSLKSVFPEIAAQWHPTKNGELSPEDVSAHSNKRVFWKCYAADDHEWDSTIGLRTGLSRGCPYCTHQRPSANTSLKYLFPKVAAQWHPTKNKELKPEDILPFSGKPVWWKCPKGRDHEWQATPANRTGNESGCPYCTGKRASVTNSLAARYPHIAGEWHKVKNGALSPNDVTCGSNKVAWWRCRSGHLWQQKIRQRTKTQSGCSTCKKAGKDSLAPVPAKTIAKKERIDFFDID